MEENYVWIIISAVTAVIAVFILLVTLRARKKKTEDYFKENLRKVIRDEAIARALNNYSGSETGNHWLVRINEVSPIDLREHFFTLDAPLTIGREFSLNRLCVYDAKADKRQVRVEVKRNTPVIIGAGQSGETVFFYKKKHGRDIVRRVNLVHGMEINLFTGDRIFFGDTEMTFTLYNEGKGIC